MIKFRGFSVSEQRWMYGQYNVDGIDRHFITVDFQYCYDEGIAYPISYQVDPESLGICDTSIKDIDNNEVFAAFEYAENKFSKGDDVLTGIPSSENIVPIVYCVIFIDGKFYPSKEVIMLKKNVGILYEMKNSGILPVGIEYEDIK